TQEFFMIKKNEMGHGVFSPLQIIHHSMGAKLARLVKLKRRFIDNELKKLRLCRTEWQVLLWVGAICPCPQQELLKNLDIDAAHLTRLLIKLEKDKYICREFIDGNRRAFLIRLTDYSKKHIIPYIE